MMEDLKKRTGLDINHFEIGNIDFLKDAAFVKLYYTLGKGQADGPAVTKLQGDI